MKLRPTRSAAPITLSIIGGIFALGVGMFFAFFGAAAADVLKAADVEGVSVVNTIVAIGWVMVIASILAIVGGSIAKKTFVGGFILLGAGIATLVSELWLLFDLKIVEALKGTTTLPAIIFAIIIPGLLMFIGGLVGFCAAFMKDKKAQVPPAQPQA